MSPGAEELRGRPFEIFFSSIARQLAKLSLNFSLEPNFAKGLGPQFRKFPKIVSNFFLEASVFFQDWRLFFHTIAIDLKSVDRRLSSKKFLGKIGGFWQNWRFLQEMTEMLPISNTK